MKWIKATDRVPNTASLVFVMVKWVPDPIKSTAYYNSDTKEFFSYIDDSYHPVEDIEWLDETEDK